MLSAKGKYVLFMDAYGSTRLSEISKLMKAIDNGYDIAIGSRMRKTSEVMVKKSLARKYISHIFMGIVHVLTVKGI